jgi:hypothetical protein
MLAPEEENESEVRRVDQDNINKFARLNARLHDGRSERERFKVCHLQYCTCTCTCAVLHCIALPIDKMIAGFAR